MHIQQNISLQNYNTFHLDAKARYFVDIHSIQDMQALIQDPIFQSNKHLILGGGSNILFTQDYDGLVLHNMILGREVTSQDDHRVLVRLGAGEQRHDFVMRAVSQNYGGIENLAFIPGCVGGAPMQNIGAYGMEAQDTIHSVEYVDLEDGTIHTLTREQCHFAYRDSIFKHELRDTAFITHVTFRLQTVSPNYQFQLDYKDIQTYMTNNNINEQSLTVQQVADMVSAIRRAKLPDRTQIGTAGSFFKNPFVSQQQFDRIHSLRPDVPNFPGPEGIKIPAGWLIEHSGLKGIQRGPVGTYGHHALVLVHYGGGTGKDIAQLAQYIQDTVFTTFGVQLEPEVNYI